MTERRYTQVTDRLSCKHSQTHIHANTHTYNFVFIFIFICHSLCCFYCVAGPLCKSVYQLKGLPCENKTEINKEMNR